MSASILHAVVLTLAAVVDVGCSFGPKEIEKTHGRYAESVRRVEDGQLLRPLVLLRYSETAVGPDVAATAARREPAAGAQARPFFVAPNPSNSNIVFRTFTSILPAASLNGSNRPTVTLTPATDGASVRRFLTPITLDTLIFLTQTSWPLDTVLRVWVDRMNGVPNAASGPGGEPDRPRPRTGRPPRRRQQPVDREPHGVLLQVSGRRSRRRAGCFVGVPPSGCHERNTG